MKLLRISAALGLFRLRREADLPKMKPLAGNFRRRPGAGVRTYRCSLGTNTVLGLITKGLFVVPPDGGAENCSLAPPASPKVVPRDCPFNILSASSSGSARRSLAPAPVVRGVRRRAVPHARIPEAH
jgi:hypothetical protein